MIDAVSLDAGSPVPSRPESGGVSPLADGFAAAAENLAPAPKGLKSLDLSAVDRFRAAMGETAAADDLLAYAFAPPPRNAEAAAEAVPAARPGETVVQPTPHALSSTPAGEAAPDSAAVPAQAPAVPAAAAPEQALPPGTLPAEAAAVPIVVPAEAAAVPAAVPAEAAAVPETPDAAVPAPVAPGAVPAEAGSALPAAHASAPRRAVAPAVSPAAAAAIASPRRKAAAAEEPDAVPAAPQPLQAAPALPVSPAAADVAPVAAPGAVRAAEATAAAARTHEIAEAVESVVAAMEVTPGLAQGNGAIRITLRPDVLDGSEIRLAVDGDALSVQVSPATGEVAALVERNIASFERSLAERVPSFQIAVSVAPRRVRGRDDA